MTRYRDDRFDDRYDRDDRYDDRDLTSDDRRFRDRDFGYGDRSGRSDRDDDRRGMMDRMRDLFGGRDGDDRRGERYLYANRSGMGRGMGGRDRDGDDRSDMGMGYGSMGYGGQPRGPGRCACLRDHDEHRDDLRSRRRRRREVTRGGGAETMNFRAPASSAPALGSRAARSP